MARAARDISASRALRSVAAAKAVLRMLSEAPPEGQIREYKEALGLLKNAITVTRDYLDKTRNGLTLTRNEDQYLIAHAWFDASAKIDEFNPEISRLCQIKGLGWEDRRIWDLPEYRDLPTHLIQMIAQYETAMHNVTTYQQAMSEFYRLTSHFHNNNTQVPLERDSSSSSSSGKGGFKMDPMTIISTISAGLSLLDQFRDLSLKLMGRHNKRPSLHAEETSGALEIRENGQTVDRIESSRLHMNAWDERRYNTLWSKININWKIYNDVDAKLPLSDAFEKARFGARLEDIRGELCTDFREMLRLYEATLGVSLEDHYSLYSVCGNS